MFVIHTNTNVTGQLWEVLQQAWEKLSKEYFDFFVERMIQVFSGVIATKCGYFDDTFLSIILFLTPIVYLYYIFHLRVQRDSKLDLFQFKNEKLGNSIVYSFSVLTQCHHAEHQTSHGRNVILFYTQ